MRAGGPREPCPDDRRAPPGRRTPALGDAGPARRLRRAHRAGDRSRCSCSPRRPTETFAWTIEPPLTAAFIGAGYAAGFVLVVLSLRDPVWAHSRVPVLTIFVFVVLTLVATLLHINRMHFDDDFGGLDFLAKAAAWFWLAVYVVVPVAMLVAARPAGARARATTRRRATRCPWLLRVALAVESAVLLVVGAAALRRPDDGGVGLAVAADAVHRAGWSPPGCSPSAWRRRWRRWPATCARLRTAAIAYTVFGVLVLVAVARFTGHARLGRPADLDLRRHGRRRRADRGRRLARCAPAGGPHRG